MAPIPETHTPGTPPIEQGGVASDQDVGEVAALNEDEGEDEWVLVRRKQRKKGWTPSQRKNFKRFGDVYEPYHSLVTIPQQPQAVAPAPNLPPVQIPVQVPVQAPAQAPVQVPLPPPPPPAPPQVPHIAIPQIADTDDDDDYTDVDSDDDDATVILDYPGAGSPLPHTGDTSDELDEFESAPSTPGGRTPVAGPSSQTGAPSGAGYFRPLPLTPPDEAFVTKVLGKRTGKTKASIGTPKSHRLRSKGAVSPSGLPPSFRK